MVLLKLLCAVAVLGTQLSSTSAAGCSAMCDGDTGELTFTVRATHAAAAAAALPLPLPLLLPLLPIRTTCARVTRGWLSSIRHQLQHGLSDDG